MDGLSAAGAERRERMLRILQGEVVRQGRRRRIRRIALAAALPVLAAAAGIQAYRMVSPRPGRVEMARSAEAPAPAVPSPPVVSPPPAPPGRSRRIEVVRDDPAVLDRVRIGDAELLSLLASAGRPSGLIRTGGRVIVTDTPGRSR